MVEAAKLHVLDVIGCGLAAHGLGIAAEGRATMSELGGEPEASVIGLETGLPAPNAAFANAMLCHGLDFDDTHSESVAHVSTVVVPAAVALAEARGASGRELLAAVIAGNEITTRVGMAAPGAFHKRGFHPTAICGIFGATAAAARLGELTPDAASSALGIAGSMASGLFAYLDDATATKPIHPAWAAHGALLAARLAEHGAEGPPGVLENRFGVYHAFVDARIDLEPQLADLGERWETPRIAFKPYPACHFIHGSLGATETLTGEIDHDEIEEVVVTCPGGRRGARARAGGREGGAANRLRGQVQPPVLDGGDARPRSRRPDDVHACGARRPARCSHSQARCATRRGSTRATRRRSRVASGSPCATDARSRRTSRTSSARRRTR